MTVAIRTILLASTIFAATPAFAQDASDVADDSDTIVVIGTALPPPPGSAAYSTAEIDRDRLLADASGRIENALRDVADVQQFRRSDSRSANPSAQGVTLRGLGGNASSRALVLLDGVPVADPFFGYIPFNAVAPERLASARITRGGGTGAFGAGALTGTIELTSASPASLPALSARGLYGSGNASEVSVATAGPLGAGHVVLGGRYDRGDGFYTVPEATRGPNDVRARYANGSLSAQAVIPTGGESELQARALVFRDDRTLRYAGADSRSEGVDTSLRFVARGPWQFEALAYAQARNFANVVVSSTRFVPVLDQRATPSTGLGGKIELRPPTGKAVTLRFGLDARQAEGELRENAISAFSGSITARRQAGGRNLTAGLFGEGDWTLGDLTLTGGARIDRYKITRGFFAEANAAGVPTIDQAYPDRAGWEPSVRTGLRYQVAPALALRSAAYTGFRLPTLNELYRPFTVFPVVTRANPALSPERLRGIEAGFDWAPREDVGVSITGFANRLEDAIANVTIGPNLRERQNIDAIVAYGVEFDVHAALGAFDLSASYAFSDAKVSATGAAAAIDGRPPAQSPRHAASATIGWNHDAARASLTGRYVGRQFEDDLGANPLPAAFTLDGFASVPLSRRASLVARVENLFDAEVVTRRVGNDSEIGAPRIVWLGLTIDIR